MRKNGSKGKTKLKMHTCIAFRATLVEKLISSMEVEITISPSPEASSEPDSSAVIRMITIGQTMIAQGISCARLNTAASGDSDSRNSSSTSNTLPNVKLRRD